MYNQKRGITKNKRCVPCFCCLKKQLSLCKINNSNKDSNNIIFTIDSENLDIPEDNKCEEGCANLIENNNTK